MTAPALNPAQFVPPGLTGGANAKAAQATGPLAGFEALMAALFPQAEPGIAAAPPAGLASAPAMTASADPLLAPTGDTLGETSDEAAAPQADAAPAPVGTEYIALPTTATVTPDQPTATAEGVDATAEGLLERPRGAKTRTAAHEHAGVAHNFAPKAAPTGEGKDVAAGAPVDGVEAEESSDTAGDTAEAKLPVLPETVAKPAQPPAWGVNKLPGTPAAPALTNANPNANLAEKAEAPPADTTTAPPEVAAAAPAPTEMSKAPAAPAFASRPEPTAAPATPARTAKSERNEASGETTSDSDLRPVEAADKSPHAKATATVAKPAHATAEPVEAKGSEAKASSDAPDATVLSEARAADASAAPAAETSSRQVRGAPETVANLAAQIVKKLEARTTRFDVELDPHGLGKVDVRVEIGAHGRITAAMTFDNPQAAQDVKARAAELQRALEQAGFDLSGGALSFDVAQDHGRGQGRAWQDQGEGSTAFRGQAFRAALETAGDAAEAANQGALRLRRGVNSGLDLRI